MGTIFVLGTRAGVGEPPNTKNTRVSRVFRVQRGESAGEGGEAAQHEERAHVGTFCVLGCRESALARKSCPRGHDFRVGDEGWGRSHRTRKTRACRVFFVFGGVRVQERAGRQPSTKNVPMWARSVCWVAGEGP